MKTILYVLASVSAIGLVLSIASHIAALLGTRGSLGDLTFVLHVGAIVIGLPAVLVAHRISKHAAAKDFWKAALRGCPQWMRYMTYGFFGYALLNFAFFIFTAPKGGGPGAMPPQVMRGFSGHWMVFYSAFLAVFYSAASLWDQDLERRCLSGHTVAPFAKFCDQCGQPITDLGDEPRAR